MKDLTIALTHTTSHMHVSLPHTQVCPAQGERITVERGEGLRLRWEQDSAGLMAQVILEFKHQRRLPFAVCGREFISNINLKMAWKKKKKKRESKRAKAWRKKNTVQVEEKIKLQAEGEKIVHLHLSRLICDGTAPSRRRSMHIITISVFCVTTNIIALNLCTMPRVSIS